MSFTNSSNFQVDSSIVNSITGTNNTTTNYYQNFSRNEFGLSTLAKEVAFSALHDSEARYPQPNVLPGTREEILRRLSGWCEHPSKSSRVFWVSGAAGVGKSAIAQALSEKYIQTGQLAAGFFFSRNDSSRDKLEPFVATIAHQLATSNHALKPLVSPHISQIVSSMPGILHKNVESQFQTLIAEPCAQVDPRRWTQLPRLIIIDGVDECISVASQKRLLEMIKTMTTTLPFDFLLFSRPEPHISQIFRHESFIPTPFSLSLGDFAQAVQEDIKKYLYHEFARIREEHWHNLPRPQASWPGNSIILQLLHKSTGQFIYATTVTKYIKHGKLPLTPMKRLDVILQAKGMVNSSSPYPDLDLLYSQILQFCINEDVKLQQILRLIVSPFGHYKAPEPNKAWNQEPRRSLYRLHLQLYGAPESVGYTSLWALEHLLELGQGEASVLLSGLHSILDVPASPVENVMVLHASFSEFLLDPHRAGEFYIGTKFSSQDWNQLITACRLRMLCQFCMESKNWPSDSDDRSANGIQNIDIGSLNVWGYIQSHLEYGSTQQISINKEMAIALNEFNPHLYLSTLLCWHFHTDVISVVSRFPILFRSSNYHWGSHIAHVQTQIFKLFMVFNSLKTGELKIDESCSIEKFISRCTSFFQGFYVAFSVTENKELVRFNLLACQLSICRSDMWNNIPPYSHNTGPGWYYNLNNRRDILLEIIPSSDDTRQYAAVRPGWEAVRIDRNEGDMLWELLDNRERSWVEKMQVVVSSEMKDWVYKLAHLDWENTKEIYLEARRMTEVNNRQAVGREGSSRESVELHDQSLLGEERSRRLAESNNPPAYGEERSRRVPNLDHRSDLVEGWARRAHLNDPPAYFAEERPKRAPNFSNRSDYREEQPRRVPNFNDRPVYGEERPAWRPADFNNQPRVENGQPPWTLASFNDQLRAEREGPSTKGHSNRSGGILRVVQYCLPCTRKDDF